jgi:hypothetical protein
MQSQTAVLFDFTFDVAPGLRQELPKYDGAGRAKGNYVRGEWVPETTRETLNSRYVESICETLTAALIDVYGYEDVHIIYPGPMSMTVHPSRMDGFPKASLKKAVKRNPSDTYIQCEITLKGSSSGTLVVMNKQREASLKVNAEITLTAFRQDGTIENLQSIKMSDLIAAFDENRVVRLEDEFTRVFGAGYLSQSDMERIFLASLQNLLR